MGDGWLTLRPGRVTGGKRSGTHHIAGWVSPWAGLDGCGKPRFTGIRSLDRPDRSESLYRLSYPGPHTQTELRLIPTPLQHGTHNTDKCKHKNERQSEVPIRESPLRTTLTAVDQLAFRHFSNCTPAFPCQYQSTDVSRSIQNAG